jgi:AraC-like DNA-binding protein
MTRRYATNLIVAIADRPLRLRLPRRRAGPCAAAVCTARAQRAVDAVDTPFLSLNLDPDTPEARRLEALAPGRSVVPVDRAQLAAWDQAMRDLLDGRLDAAQARRLGDGLVAALTGPLPAAVALDARVRRVAEQLKAELPSDIDTDSLAALAGLSATRLVHLFSEQFGMPMSSFLLWAKLRRALSLIQGGQSLTDIAQACGFADSSHLTRTFQAFYAIKPSLVGDSRYVQVRMC